MKSGGKNSPSNTKVIDRYNQYRYDRPTYLTVQSGPQIQQKQTKKKKKSPSASKKKLDNDSEEKRITRSCQRKMHIEDDDGQFSSDTIEKDEKMIYRKFKQSILVNKNSQTNFFNQSNMYHPPRAQIVALPSANPSGLNSQNNSRNVPLALDSGSLNYDSRKYEVYSGRSLAPADNNTFDCFGSNYHSDEDEDYSEKEDLIQNKKFYQKDMFKPFEKSIPKTEIEYLLKQQGPVLHCPESPIQLGENNEQYLLRKSPIRQFNDLSSQSLLVGKKPILGKRLASSPQKQYTEFLQQSQNIQHSLIYQDYNPSPVMLDHSIEPIVTRNRSLKFQKKENSEKTFSFKDSLRESNKQAKINQGPQNQQIYGPSYQNNYYYNFNNNFGGGTPKRHVHFQDQTPQIIPKHRNFDSDDDKEKSEKSEEINHFERFEKMLMQHVSQNLEKKRVKKQKKKSDTTKLAQKLPPQSQKILQQLTDLLAKTTDKKKLSKNQLAQIGEYQVQLMQQMQESKIESQSEDQEETPEEPEEKQEEVPSPEQHLIDQQQQINHQNFKHFYQNYFQQTQAVQQFTNLQLKELIEQTNIYIQLLFQVLLLLEQDKQQPKNNNVLQTTTKDNYLLLDQMQEKQQPKDDAEKLSAYTLLYEFINYRDESIKQFKESHKIQELPTYEIPWISSWMQKAYRDNSTFRISPQVSYFQVPLLEYAPKVIEAFLNNLDSQTVFLSMRPLLNQQFLPIKCKQVKSKEIMPMAPCKSILDKDMIDKDLIDPFYNSNSLISTFQPPMVNCANNRRKFSFQEDNFLFMGLLRQGCWKNLESIRDSWLPKKSINELKHRIKNLTCRRAPDNLIKKLKKEYNLPLRQGWLSRDIAFGAKKRKEQSSSDEESGEEGCAHQQLYFNEMYLLAKGIKWFGTGDLMNEIMEIKKPFFDVKSNEAFHTLINNPQIFEKTILMSQFYRWNQISRYFLPSRTGEFLFVEYHNIIQNREKSDIFGKILLELSIDDYKDPEEIELDKKLKNATRYIDMKEQEEKKEQTNIQLYDIIKNDEYAVIKTQPPKIHVSETKNFTIIQFQ